MHYDIRFPNLNVVLDHVGKNISIGNFTIAYYGIIIAAGMLLGMMLTFKLAKYSGQDPDKYYDIMIIGMIVGIIGARLYYVAFSWDTYKDDPLSIFNLRNGGLAIYGGIIAAVIFVFIYSRIKKRSMLQILDTVAPGIVLGQALGRWGNFFNREAFGRYTDGLFAMQLPIDAVFSASVTDEMREHLTACGGVDHIQVHPTFFYESMWNLCVFAVLLLFFRHRKEHGEVFFLYVFGYALGRVWIEGLRTDQLWIPGTQIPVSQVLAGVLILVGAAAFVSLRFVKKHKNVT